MKADQNTYKQANIQSTTSDENNTDQRNTLLQKKVKEVLWI